ncbi:MAG: TetR/AcrR family transcriptional regulator, partial [Lachnospiraceae bacterium]|nr:TetR/AcrR family transcriptional regulator [Lachnospiraceae bacterium]MCI5481457.1 TetR/AcrR family transcriptional regulator [Lachnospiraceae bacterium]
MSFEAYEKITEEKRNRILSTGIKEFSGKSYKDVSTDHITKACGISKGLLFHYFGSKREFYFYCLEKA